MTATMKIERPIVSLALQNSSVRVTRRQLVSAATRDVKTIIVTGLPLLLEESSLRIELKGADLVQYSSQLVAGKSADEPANELRLLTDKERQLEEKLKWLQAECKNLSEVELELPDEPDSDVDNWLAYTAVCGDLVGEHIKQQLVLLKERREVQEKIKNLQNNKKQNIQPVTKELQLSITNWQQDKIELAVSYQVAGAAWKPGYALRIASGGQTATLELYANIAQLTGEDWPAIPLTLSANDVHRGTRLPKLSSWHIGRAKNSSSSWRALPEDGASLLADYLKFVAEYNKAPARLQPAPVGAAPAFAPFDEEDIVEDEKVPNEDCCVEPTPQPVFSRAKGRASMLRPAMAAMMGAGAMPMASAMVERCCAEPAMSSMAPPRPQKNKSAALQPETSLLDYSLLEMSAAEEPGAGTLRPQKSMPSSEVQQKRLLLANWQSEHQTPKAEATFLALYAGQLLEALPADGQWHKVALAAFELPLSVEYWSIPRVELSVIRCGKVPNNSGLPLLGGQLEVYWDNQLLTSTNLPATPKGGVMSIPMGLEESIKLERHVEHHESQSGLISQTTNYQDEVTIAALSSLAVPVELHIIDRMPISYEDNVKINLQKAVPENNEYHDLEGKNLKNGLLGWSIKCQPAEKSLIKFSYNIELPAKQEVVGGGQRG